MLDCEIDLVKWLANFKQAWVSKNFGELKHMFNETFEYYESPFHVPATDIEDIMKRWKDIETQKIKSLTFTPLVKQGNKAVVNWSLECNEGSFDGIYLLEFNMFGKCIYFKRWAVKK